MEFFKYNGTGNDFIILDNRKNDKRPSKDDIAFMCHRRFGIGADGLIMLNLHPRADFSMQYYNSDGNLSTMCGNGGRCIVAFAKKIELIKDYTVFLASDGEHEAWINDMNVVSLKMKDVGKIETFPDGFFLDTGSPHFVKFTTDTKLIDVISQGREIRHQGRFEKGTNVNFVEIAGKGKIMIRTYERGVEDETLACGTGSVASAICSVIQNEWEDNNICVDTLGGPLEVKFNRTGDQCFSEIWLKGSTNFVYKGVIDTI